MEFIRVDVSDRVATLTLDDPDERNALSPQLLAELVEALDRLEADESIGALVLTGAPPAFCAGARKTSMPRSGGDAASPRMSLDADGLLRIGRAVLPTVAAVNGAAIGGGMNLALSCDVTVMGSSGWFESRFASLGLHPGGGHSWLVSTAAGRQIAAAAALFGERFDGRRAVHAGLAVACVPDDELLDAAQEMARRAAELPRPLAIAIKQSLRRLPATATHDHAVVEELGQLLWSRSQPWARRK